MADKKFFAREYNEGVLSTGDHVVEYRKVVDRDSPRFREKVEDEVSRRILPDFDSGYLYISNNETYTIKHNLGQVPARQSFFFCTEEKPIYGRSSIYSIPPIIASNDGISVRYIDKDTCKIDTGSAGVSNSETSGYLRIMFWR